MNAHVDEGFRIQIGAPGPGGSMRLLLAGSLDAEGALKLSQELESQLGKGRKRLELDFAKVPYISSSGIGSLVAAIGEFRDEGGEITLLNVSEGILEIFEMLELLDYLDVATNG